MKLLVGLGNPGSRYENTRHNIGFMALDQIAEHLNTSVWRSKFQADITEATIDDTKVILLKPQTFMNLSGQSVGEVCRFYKILPQDVIVFHDELDLNPGKVRVKSGGGHAGHNGLRSLHQHIGAEYKRVRIGIGHPGDKDLVTQYVLGAFSKADDDWIVPLLRNISENLGELVKGKDNLFSSRIQVVATSPTSGQI
jgi:peptidyl-tRNA hydrolase, PTH1 family